MTGLGPLEPLLKDPSVNDILINGHECVYVERAGVLEPCGVRFKDEAHLLRIINKIVSAVGRRVDESHPMCDARLMDGSRVNVAVRPIGVDGPLVSIRKFSKKPFNLNKLVEVGAIRPQMAEVLAASVKARVTLIISGGTGSGKTTMLNALSAFISEKERLLTIEDAAELQLQQPMWDGWRPVRPTSRARAKSGSASWSRMRCACGPTASSSASAAARKPSTCCRP
jgi:pilus assembly protein CpaF